MSKTLVIIGSEGLHIANFSTLVKPLFDSIIFIGEKKIDSKSFDKQHLINFRSKSPLKLLKTIKTIKVLLAKINPSIIHIHQVNRVALLSIIAINKKYPVVTTAWGSDVLVLPKESFFKKKLVQYVLNKSDYVTADSNQMLEVIKELSPKTKTKLFLFGIDILNYIKKEKIIYSNRDLYPIYNINKVIDLFSNFHKNNLDWKLIIASRGPEKEKLEKQVVALKLSKAIKFVGFLNHNNNNSYYKKASIYISIPSSDGTAVSLLEAMSAGCIPIVSDLPVSKEWIINDETGIIFNQNIQNDSIRKALELNQKLVAKKNISLVEKKGTKKVNLDVLISIYTSLS